MKYIFGLVIGCLLLTGCKGFEDISKTQDIERLKLEIKVREFELEARKIDTDLRRKVVETCISKGKVPIVINGNVDCK